MKLKERLIPEIVVEIDYHDIPLSQILEFFDVISNGRGIEFDPYEKDLEKLLLLNNVIEPMNKNFAVSLNNMTFDRGENYNKFREEFYDLYNKMDFKQLSRERKLKELIDESI